MNILITGGTGFIGKKLADHAAAAGHSVVITSRRPAEAVHSSAQVITCDLTPGNIAAALEGQLPHPPDMVFHLASSLRFYAGKKALYRANVALTQHVLDYCARSGVKTFVYASSIEAQGPGETGGPALRETDSARPVSNYGWSKLQAENVVAAAHRAGIKRVIARIGNVYVPGAASMAAEMAENLINKRSLWRFRAELMQASLSPICLDDLVDALMIIAQKGEDGGIYNLVGGQPVSVERIIEALAKQTGRHEGTPARSKLRELELVLYEKYNRLSGRGDMLSYLVSGGTGRLSRTYSGEKASLLGIAPVHDVYDVIFKGIG